MCGLLAACGGSTGRPATPYACQGATGAVTVMATGAHAAWVLSNGRTGYDTSCSGAYGSAAFDSQGRPVSG